MTEYITKERAQDLIVTATQGNGSRLAYMLSKLEDEPPADVAPVVHAKWEHTHTSESYFNECWRCSACGFDDTEGFVFEFCPHCGARMDGR